MLFFCTRHECKHLFRICIFSPMPASAWGKFFTSCETLEMHFFIITCKKWRIYSSGAKNPLRFRDKWSVSEPWFGLSSPPVFFLNNEPPRWFPLKKPPHNLQRSEERKNRKRKKKQNLGVSYIRRIVHSSLWNMQTTTHPNTAQTYLFIPGWGVKTWKINNIKCWRWMNKGMAAIQLSSPHSNSSYHWVPSPSWSSSPPPQFFFCLGFSARFSNY